MEETNRQASSIHTHGCMRRYQYNSMVILWTKVLTKLCQNFTPHKIIQAWMVISLHLTNVINHTTQVYLVMRIIIQLLLQAWWMVIQGPSLLTKVKQLWWQQVHRYSMERRNSHLRSLAQQVHSQWTQCQGIMDRARQVHLKPLKIIMCLVPISSQI